MDKAKVDPILGHLSQSIGGDWLLVGGTLVQLQYNGERATEDIDLVLVRHDSKSKEVAQNELFQFTLTNLGFGPELVNLSVEFFIERFTGWRDELCLFQKGPKGRIFRPSLSLFCALKAARGSELDASDVRTAVEAEGADKLQLAKLQAWLKPKEYLWLSKVVASI